MHSVQSVSKQSKLSRRQRRFHRYSATSAPAEAAAASAAVVASSSSSLPPHYYKYKAAKAYRNTVPIVHGIIVSNISLVLLQKEYIEQFYFEKRNGGGGPDPDANADSYRHLNSKHQPHNRFNTQLQLLRFG